MADRNDTRYTDSQAPCKMVAWAGPDLTLDMGGWSGEDPTEFLEAIEDEARVCLGEPLACIRIVDVSTNQTLLEK